MENSLNFVGSTYTGCRLDLASVLEVINPSLDYDFSFR